MRKSKFHLPFLAMAISIGLALSGCANATGSGNSTPASAEFSGAIDDDYLIGDKIELEGTFSASSVNGSDLKTSIEVSTDGGETWNEITSEAVSAGELAEETKLNASYEFVDAGKTKFRAAITSSTDEVAQSQTSSIKVSDLTALVRSLYYEFSQVGSLEEEIRFTEKNNFPGAYDMASDEWKDRIQLNLNQEAAWGWWAKVNYIADLDSISPDPNWKLKKDKCVAPWDPPEGSRFYIVSVEVGMTKQDVHVGYLDGRLYFFSTYCI